MKQHVVRALYNLAWWIAMPLVLARLWWRGRKEPGYRRHVWERLGWYAPATGLTRIWIHAVSVGETRAVAPLIEALLAAYPTHSIILTHMTPTGRSAGQSLFAHQPRVQQAYLPYDTAYMVGRFIRHFSPRLCLLIETEVWPSLIDQCSKRSLPVLLMNARLSERSLKKAHRLAWLMRPAAAQLTCVAAQTQEDAARLHAFGAPRVEVTGSIKFDVTPPPAMCQLGADLRTQIGSRPVILCASTRDGEEALILDALDGFDLVDVLLLIVPRHPQRFAEVERLIAGRGLSLQRRSELGTAALAQTTAVLIGDSMGEMFAYYAACDLAFIGGSLLPLGGQNLIEACALGKPVLIGPHTFNFASVTEDAISAGAAQRVIDGADLMRKAQTLLHNPSLRTAMAEKALAFAQQHRGATARSMNLLRAYL